MGNLDNDIEKLKREIRQDKKIIVALFTLVVALRLIYTTVDIQHEKSTGKKQFQVIPYDAALYAANNSKRCPLPGKNEIPLDWAGKRQAPARPYLISRFFNTMIFTFSLLSGHCPFVFWMPQKALQL